MTFKVIIKPTTKSKKLNASTVPAYFLSLTITGVRCFGPKQTLDLSDGKGNPSRWTIILGNNGYGKTTLLQSLVALIPVGHTGHNLAPYCFGRDTMPKWKPFIRAPRLVALLEATFCSGRTLTENGGYARVSGYQVEGDYDDGWYAASIKAQDDIGYVNCFGYGAARRMGETSLAEQAEDYSQIMSNL
jgi:energy-coupling factor transporter ATP-binding protein EcfA2